MGGSSSKPKPKAAPAAKPAPPAAPKKPALLDSAVATTQVATRTDPGSGADDEDNQDAVHLSESGGVHVVALFDGHGDDGKAVADACAAAVLGCDLVDGAKGHAPSDHRLLVVDLEVVAA